MQTLSLTLSKYLCPERVSIPIDTTKSSLLHRNPTENLGRVNAVIGDE